MDERIRFALERFGLPRHSSHVAQLFSLGIITFMDDRNTQLQREVRELRSEVQFLRRLVEGVVLVIGIGLVVLIPSLVVFGIALGGMILFGFLVSRQRRMIFQSLFRKRRIHDHDA